MLARSTDVLIVGAGPSGLALAATLARQRVDAVVIDRLPQPQDTSRAAAIHARTLEVLEAIGASDELVQAGLPTHLLSVRDRERVLLSVDFGNLHTRYPYVLMLAQQRTEAILTQRLEWFGGKVWRGHQATALRIEGDAAEVDITVTGQPLQTIRARHVVAADGMHSLIRQQAGIGFEPGTYAESFVLGDVRMEWPSGTSELQLFLAPAGLLVVGAFAAGHYRIIATLPDPPEQPGVDDLQAILDQRGPGGATPRITELAWSSRFRIHHGVAARYRAGPVLLVGDAAHVHSPAGGQGMNIGIQDACDLGNRLAAALQPGADAAAILDGYERARRPAATRVVALTDRLTRMATLQGHWRQALRNLAIETIGHLPGVPQKLAAQFAELGD